jgi:hypothetical protein
MSAIEEPKHGMHIEAGGVAPTSEAEHYVLNGASVTKVNRTST